MRPLDCGLKPVKKAMVPWTYPDSYGMCTVPVSGVTAPELAHMAFWRLVRVSQKAKT